MFKTARTIISVHQIIKKQGRKISQVVTAAYATTNSGNQKIWELFNGAFSDAILGGNYQGLTYVPASVGFNPSWGASGTNLDIYNIADKEPSWQPLYAPSANSVSKAFKIFLDNVDVQLDPETAAKQQQYLNDIQLQQNAFNAARQTYMQQWIEEGRPDNFQQWLMESYGSNPLQPKKDTIDESIRKYTEWLKTTQFSSVAALLKAQEDYNNPANEMILALPGNKTNSVKGYSITPSIDSTLADWNVNVNLNPVSFTISTKDGDEKRRAMSFGGSVSYFGIFNVGGTYSQADYFSEKHNTSITFHTQATKTFSISQWDWFNGSLLGQYRNGPWKSTKPADMEFWGPKGILNMIPQQIQIVYQPAVTIQLENSTYTSFKREAQGSAGIQIGPFTFKIGSQGYSESRITYHDDSSSVTIEDTSKIPKIVAVKCTAPNATSLLRTGMNLSVSRTLAPNTQYPCTVQSYVMINNLGPGTANVAVTPQGGAAQFYHIPANNSQRVNAHGNITVTNMQFSGGSVRVDLY